MVPPAAVASKLNKLVGRSKKLRIPPSKRPLRDGHALVERPKKLRTTPIKRPLPDGHALARGEFSGESPRAIAESLKAGWPDYLVFVQNGFFWEVFEGDAEYCSSRFGWKLASHGAGSNFTGVPINAIRFREDLEAEGVSYMMVAQKEYPSKSSVIVRAVSELFDPDQR